MCRKITIISFLFISSLSTVHSRVLVSDKSKSKMQQRETSNCNQLLINSFLFGVDFTNKTTSTKTTELQQLYCPTIKSTCCEDSLFNHFLQNIKEKIFDIKHLIELHFKIIKKISELSDSTFNSIFENSYYFKRNNVVEIDADKLEAELANIRKNPNTYISRAKNGYNFLIQNNSSFLCEICAANNQHQFTVPDSNVSVVEKVLKLNVSHCFSILQNEAIGNFSDLLNDISNLNRIVLFLNIKYNTGFTQNHLIEMAKDDLDYKYNEDDCRDFDYFSNNLEECVDLCKEVGMLNENPLFIYSRLLASNYVILKDFFSEDGIFKKLKENIETKKNFNDLGKDAFLPLNKISRFEQQKIIKNKISKLNTVNISEFIITPAIKAHYNLNLMPIEYLSSDGWQYHKFNISETDLPFEIENKGKIVATFCVYLLLGLINRF